MRKYIACLFSVFLVVTAFAIAPAAAAPKLAGNWVLAITYIEPVDGVIQNKTMGMTLNATANPLLFYGTMTGGAPDPQYITIMMDAGANMHFTISFPDVLPPFTIHGHAYGRGTASTSKIVGSWGDDLGYTGVFTATRQQ